MLAQPFCFFWIIKFLHTVRNALAIFSLIFVLSVWFLKLYNQETSPEVRSQSYPLQAERIETKPAHLEWLACIKHHESFYAQDLEQELVYLGKNSRPDALEHQVQYLVGLKGTHQTALVQPGQKLYLLYGASGLEFSQDPQPLWIKFREIQSDAIEYDAVMLLAQEETHEIYQEKIQGIASLEGATVFNEELLQEVYFQKFEKVKWWRPDLFYEAYGGESFAYTKGCHRLEFDSSSDQEKGLVCFVKPHTQLIFKDFQWEVCQECCETREHPMAEILSIAPFHMEIKIWDVSGIHSKHLSLTPQRLKPWSVKAEEIFTQLRQRTARQISCKVGGKNMLLKEGDWLLHKGEHWKLLHTAEEIERYISLQLEGELFVCEGIEKNQGNAVFKGQLFDTMREQIQAVRIPIAAVRNKRLGKRQKEKQNSFQQAAIIPQTNREPADTEVDSEDELLRLANPQKRHEFSK